MTTKHTSFFPLILLALTLILALGIVFFSSPNNKQIQNRYPQTISVSEVDYQESFQKVFSSFFLSYQNAKTDAERLYETENTLNIFLNMRVPAAYKAIHLECALDLQKIKQGLVSNPQDVLEGHRLLKERLSQISWFTL